MHLTLMEDHFNKWSETNRACFDPDGQNMTKLFRMGMNNGGFPRDTMAIEYSVLVVARRVICPRIT